MTKGNKTKTTLKYITVANGYCWYNKKKATEILTYVIWGNA